MRMPPAGILQQLEAVVVQIEEFTAKVSCVLCCEPPMYLLITVVCPAGIMQQHKQANDCDRSSGPNGGSVLQHLK
jgi:hypothetical protein